MEKRMLGTGGLEVSALGRVGPAVLHKACG